ncbi:MAG: alpha/beta hydrolase [Alphaproteobacteria bacterium]|nr:alpha/beta hydrolase [Alphaproteobacteria bacterium]
MARTPTAKEIDHINLEYLPRLTVKNADEYLQKSAKRSARVRKQLACHLDVAYGDTAGQTLDVFPAARKGAPVHVFIHGGYWRALDKHIYSHVAAPMVAAGATVVLPNYDLCPKVRITDIVDQVRRAIVWVYKNIARHNGDPKRIFVSGHSAGGHLTGMMIATDWAKLAGLPKDLIKGTAPLSGLFDVEPHRHTQLQPDIRLTAREARLMSPMFLPPVATGPAIVAVGGVEPDSFHWQSLEYAARLRLHGIKAEYVATPGDNHFAIIDRLGNAKDPLTRALIAQMGL